MSKTIKGIYRNGQVELLEKPEGIEEAPVDVTFHDLDADSDALRQRREEARKWLRETGLDLGGAPYPTRDELYDRTR